MIDVRPGVAHVRFATTVAKELEWRSNSPVSWIDFPDWHGLLSSAGSLEESAMVIRSLVSVVDDDESVRESLPDLLREFGFDVQAFASAEEFLTSDSVCKTRCLILDVALP